MKNTSMKMKESPVRGDSYSVINYHDGKAVYISESGHMKRYSMLS